MKNSGKTYLKHPTIKLGAARKSFQTGDATIGMKFSDGSVMSVNVCSTAVISQCGVALFCDHKTPEAVLKLMSAGDVFSIDEAGVRAVKAPTKARHWDSVAEWSNHADQNYVYMYLYEDGVWKTQGRCIVNPRQRIPVIAALNDEIRDWYCSELDIDDEDKFPDIDWTKMVSTYLYYEKDDPRIAEVVNECRRVAGA